MSLLSHGDDEGKQYSRGMALVFARLGRDRWLRLAARGVLGMLGRGSSMSGGVSNWGDAAPAAQHEAGEQECDQDVTHDEWDGEG